jgi:hypothetical protein
MSRNISTSSKLWCCLRKITRNVMILLLFTVCSSFMIAWLACGLLLVVFQSRLVLIIITPFLFRFHFETNDYSSCSTVFLIDFKKCMKNVFHFREESLESIVISRQEGDRRRCAYSCCQERLNFVYQWHLPALVYRIRRLRQRNNGPVCFQEHHQQKQQEQEQEEEEQLFRYCWWWTRVLLLECHSGPS